MLHRNIPFRKKEQRKPVRCKGFIPGTNIKCRAELCTTNGEFLYVTFGIREMAVQRKRVDNGMRF
jgi:hypothetical protein